MKCLYVLALILVTSPAMAQVNWNSNQLGGTTFYNGYDMHCTTNRLGNSTFTNCY
jgi:hypothetical protein